MIWLIWLTSFYHYPEFVSTGLLVRSMADNCSLFASGEPLRSLLSRETGSLIVAGAEADH